MPSIIATLGLNVAGFKQGLAQAQGQAKGAGAGIQSAMGGVGRYLAGFVSVGAIAAGMKSTIQYGSKISDLSDRLGMSTDSLQEWDYALKQNGSNVFQAAKFFEKLAISRRDALEGGSQGEELAASFAKLGVTLDMLKQGRIEDIAAQITRAFQTGDPQQLIAELRDVGGRSAGEMVTTFVQGFDTLAAEARSLGLVMQEEVIFGLDSIDDKTQMLGQTIMARMGPVINFFGDLAASIYNAADGMLAMTAGLGGSLWGDLASGELNPLTLAKNAFRSAVDAGLDHEDEQTAKQQAAADAKQRKRDALLGGGSFDGEGGRENTVLTRLQKQLEKKAAAESLAQLGTPEEKLAEIARRKAELQGRMSGMSEEERIRAEMDLVDMEKSERTISKQMDKAGAKADKSDTATSKFGAHNVNQLQQMGGFLGNFAAAAAPEMAILMKQANTLEDIKKILIQQGRESANTDGVEY